MCQLYIICLLYIFYKQTEIECMARVYTDCVWAGKIALFASQEESEIACTLTSPEENRYPPPRKSTFGGPPESMRFQLVSCKCISAGRRPATRRRESHKWPILATCPSRLLQKPKNLALTPGSPPSTPGKAHYLSHITSAMRRNVHHQNSRPRAAWPAVAQPARSASAITSAMER